MGRCHWRLQGSHGKRKRVAQLLEEARNDAKRLGLLKEKVESLHRSTREKKAELSKRESVQMGAPIIIDPSGMGRDQRPYFVLCTADYVETLDRRGESYRRYPTDQLEFDKDFALDTVLKDHLKRRLRNTAVRITRWTKYPLLHTQL